MTKSAEGGSSVSALRTFSAWIETSDGQVRVVNLGLAFYALLKLGDEYRRLLFDTNKAGAVDLLNFQQFVCDWFAGKPVYQEPYWALYPPASYPILWLWVGWLNSPAARWFAAITQLAALALLVYIFLRASGAEARAQRVFVALLLPSMNATGVTIGNGQLGLYVLALLLGGLFLLRQGRWRSDLMGSVLITASLVKPSIALPFMWIVLFVPGRLRIAFLVAIEYAALTLFAVSFQGANLVDLGRQWLERSSAVLAPYGYANFSIWFTDQGFRDLILPSALLAWSILGIWVYFHRKQDIWILLGVSALVARFSVYHAVYDDVLIILPMIALYRMGRCGDPLARILLAFNVAAMLFLASWQHLASPWDLIFSGGHTLVWAADLVILLAPPYSSPARREKQVLAGEL